MIGETFTIKPYIAAMGLPRQVADEYWAKYGGTMSKQAIARLMMRENPQMWRSLDSARAMIRLVTGAFGEKKRKHATEIMQGQAHPTNPYGLPESDETIWEPFLLEQTKYGVLSDVHLPYHSVKALSSAIEYFLKHGVQNIILNGDTMDCYTLSRWEKDPRKRNFAEELETWFEFADILKREFKGDIVFKVGNHEERYIKFVASRAPELIGVPDFEFAGIMKFRELGIECVDEKRPMHFGDLTVVHGHEFGESTFSPVNVARGLFLRAKTSALCGHSHQTSQHQESDVRGNQTITYSVGCLSDLHPTYRPINKWNWGAAVISREGNEFGVDNFRINANGRVHK